MGRRENHLFYKPEEEGLGDLAVDRILTVPNLITTLRLACIPVFLVVLFGHDSRGWAGFILGALSSTDWVDGQVARRFNQSSNFGKMFDPTVDRLVMVTAIVSILVYGDSATYWFVPMWFAWLVLVREVAVSAWVVSITALGAKRMDVTWWGKVGSWGNMAAFPSFLIASEDTLSHTSHVAWLAFAYVNLVPGLIFSLLAAGQYLVRGRQALKEGRRERALMRAAANF